MKWVCGMRGAEEKCVRALVKGKGKVFPLQAWFGPEGG